MIANLAAADAKPLRVLTFLHSFAPGGVERVALRLHAAWRASEVDSRLVFGRGSGAMRAEWPGLEADILGGAPFSPARWETVWMILRLPGVIRRIRPDVLFCAGNTYTVVAVMMKLLLGARCPPVVAKISNDLVRMDMPSPVRALYRVWLRIQGRMLDRLVGIAPPMRAEIAAYSEELSRKPHCVVFTKLDIIGEDMGPELDAPDAFGVFSISAAGRTGLDELLAAWWSQLLSMRKSTEKRDDVAELP